jgi:hypothetical protein
MTKEMLITNAKIRKASINLEDPKFIGIRFAHKNVWHWFEVTNDGFVDFDHSYSQNTGKTKRGVMHMIRVKESLGFYKSFNN